MVNELGDRGGNRQRDTGFRESTVKEVRLTGGATGRAAVPSGASTGKFEAVELPAESVQRTGSPGSCRACEYCAQRSSSL